MNPPKMPVHIGDYKRDTGHLRAAGHGAYLMLLFHHWSTGSLPDDDDQLAAIACMTPAEWRRIKPTLEKFFQPGWRHGRVEEDLAKAKESYEKRAKAGEKGGKAKADGKQCSSNAKARLEQPLTLNLEEEKKEDTAGAGTSSNSLYVFESGVIRLNQKDFDQWKRAYSNLELEAELIALSTWAQEQGPQRWFPAVSNALTKKNREAKRAANAPEFKYMSGIEGIV